MSSEPRLIATGLQELLPMERGGKPWTHISFIIHDLCIRLGHLKDYGDNALVTPERMTYWELGNAFEEEVVVGLTNRYAQHDPERYVRPGELELDGLHGNPDFLDLLDFCVNEVKLTKISSKHEPQSPKFWKYWVQVKCYCHMMEWNLSRLHICHINADYSGGIDPHYNVWEVEWTNQELVENWRMIKSHGDKLRVKYEAAAAASNKRHRTRSDLRTIRTGHVGGSRT
jgi:hypothetical protein